MKKLEEEMHGKDVVFIGVSLDEAKDKQKWLFCEEGRFERCTVTCFRMEPG